MLLYLVFMILLAAALGAGIVSLTTTSTLTELTYNTSERARHLAQSGLDYAESALKAEDQDLRDDFRDGLEDKTFTLEDGEFILTVTPVEDQPGWYDIDSTGKAEVGTPDEASFRAAERVFVSGAVEESEIDFSEFGIRTRGQGGIVEHEDSPEEGYTYHSSDKQLVLYDEEGNPLITITPATGQMTYHEEAGSLGTTPAGPQHKGLINTGHSLELIFPGEPAYTELTIGFRRFDQGDQAEVQLAAGDANAGPPHTVSYGDLDGSSVTITSEQPFDRFTVTALTGTFGITGSYVSSPIHE